MDERRLKELLHIINIRRHDDEYSLRENESEEEWCGRIEEMTNHTVCATKELFDLGYQPEWQGDEYILVHNKGDRGGKMTYLFILTMVVASLVRREVGGMTLLLGRVAMIHVPLRLCPMLIVVTLYDASKGVVMKSQLHIVFVVVVSGRS